MCSHMSNTRKKPGPEPKRLVIDDPEEALKKLLSTPPPSRGEAGEPEKSDESDERER